MCHTHSHGSTPRHSHFGGWCVPTLLPVCAPTHPPTPIPTPSAPLHQPTPLPPAVVGVGGGSVGVVGSVTTWCTHWLCWCCPLPSHTHRACEARGGGGCVWCGCHHHCAPFPPTTTTVCAAPPCPLCVCWWWDWAQRRTVVARTLVWRCAWRLATTPTSHAVHACRLSSLSCPQPHPPTHTNGTAHSTHTWRALCASSHPLTHTLVASLPTHPPHTLVGVRVLIHLLSCAITHTAQAQAWRLPGCFGVVVTTTTPLVPHTHRDWWWAPW